MTVVQLHAAFKVLRREGEFVAVRVGHAANVQKPDGPMRPCAATSRMALCEAVRLPASSVGALGRIGSSNRSRTDWLILSFKHTDWGLTMAQTQLDYGEAEIAAFNEAARAGLIHYDEAAVREAVGLYDAAIETLLKVQDRIHAATQATGFGGFQSGKELNDGFSRKAQEGIEVIGQLIQGAMRLQEAYFRAGNLITEADQMNAAAIRFATQTSGLDDSNA